MNFNSKILIISLILIFAISFSAVSANENISDVQNAVEQNTSTVSIDDVNTVDSVNSNQVDENNLGSADVQNKVSAGEYGTFTELQNEINTKNVVTLDKDYVWDLSFNSGSVNGIVINKDVVIDGQNHTIDGNNMSRIFYITNGSVTIKNVIFKDPIYESKGVNYFWGGVIYSIGASKKNMVNLTLSNCIFKDISFGFEGNRIIGALVSTYYTNFFMDHCQAINCNMTLTAQSFYLRGHSHFIISNCEFINAGQFRSQWAEDSKIINSTFINGRTLHNDGNVSYYNCKIINDSFFRISSYEYYTQVLNITNCTFDNSSITVQKTDSVLNLFNSTFCNVNNHSAVVYEYGTAGGVISNCYFINNSAVEGGALNIADKCNITISDSTFINNTAVECGGAIFAGEFSNVTRSNLTFTNNLAYMGGNDYYQPMSIKDIIYVGVNGRGNGQTEFDPASIKFALNNIRVGGIIYFLPGNYTGDYFDVNKGVTLSAKGEVIFNGEINVYGDNVKIEKFKFIKQNIVHVNWYTIEPTGGITWYGDNGFIEDCVFADTATTGNGILVLYGDNATVNNCSFINNTAYLPVLTHWNVGGGIWNNGTNLTVKNSKFINNTAGAGSGIFSLKPLNITNTLFLDNLAMSGKFTNNSSYNDTCVAEYVAIHNQASQWMMYVYGADKFFNGVWAPNTGNNFTNISYWENNAIQKSSNSTYPGISGVGYNVVFKFYDKVTGEFKFNATNITDNTAKAIVNNVPAGYYRVVVTHAVGQTRATNNTFEFAYGKKIAQLNLIFSDNINPGDDLIVVATLNKEATGTVSFTMNNQTYIRNISDGQAILTLKAYNLVGQYDIRAIYNGNDEYYPQDSDVILSIVPTLNSNVVISNDDVIAVNGTVTLYGKVNFNIVNGVLEFVIKSGDTVVDVVNGTRAESNAWTADYKFTKTGNYIISAQYYGINLDVTEGNVIVRDISHITVDNNTINYNENAFVKFTLPVNTTGEIKLTIGDKTYTVNVPNNHNGTIVYNAGKLNAGQYNVIAEYLGDLVFAPSIGNSTLTINKINTPLIINCINNNNVLTISADLATDATGNIMISVGGKFYQITNGGSAVVSDLAAGNYDISAVYAGDINFNSQSNTTSAVITKKDVNLTATAEAIVEGQTAKIIVSTDSNVTGHIFIEINGMNLYEDINGKTATIYVNGLIIGNYTATVTYSGDDGYNGSNTTVKVSVNSVSSLVDPKMNLSYISNVKLNDNVTVFVTLPSDVNGTVTLLVNGVINTTFTVINGRANVTIVGVSDKNHYSVYYPGNGLYLNSTENISLNVILPTSITAADVVCVYNDDANIIATLKDAYGNPVKNVTVTVNFNGVKNFTTDANGQIKVSTLNVAPNKYNATITFDGTSKYDKSTATVKVTINKANPVLTAKNKKFKRKVKTKKYSVTLKTNKNAPLAGAKLTLKVKKKTFKATTNAKGTATFKIKKITKKGKYKSTVTFAGDAYYNSVSKKVKITVK